MGWSHSRRKIMNINKYLVNFLFFPVFFLISTGHPPDLEEFGLLLGVEDGAVQGKPQLLQDWLEHSKHTLSLAGIQELPSHHRRRINTKEKAKVGAAIFLAALYS